MKEDKLKALAELPDLDTIRIEPPSEAFLTEMSEKAKQKLIKIEEWDKDKVNWNEEITELHILGLVDPYDI